jgi:hypothetical protein
MNTHILKFLRDRVFRERVTLTSFLVIFLAIVMAFICSSCQNEPMGMAPSNTEFSDELVEGLSDTSAMVSGAGAIQRESASEQAVVDVTYLPAGTVLTVGEIDFESLGRHFVSSEISENVQTRIVGKSYQENADISLDDLRYLKVLHYNFAHQIQVGELIVNAVLAEDFLEIFQELFENEYEIQSMYLIDDYWTGDPTSTDSLSITNNNTSAFCYREITWGGELSRHAFGRAVDINPQQNPYVDYSAGKPYWANENANSYIDRTTGAAHMITHDDICFRLFAEHGFEWGGDWYPIVDYQHFEKPR